MRPRRAAILLIGLVLVVTGTMLLQGWSPRYRAEYFPNRPIKLVVPFSPGGGTDTFARIMKKAIEDNELLPATDRDHQS